MSSRLRIALICVLAAALPLQSVAAATMVGCVPGGPTAPPAHHEAASHSHEAGHGHAAMHVHDAVNDAAAPAVDDHGGTAQGGQGAQAKCSVCAACCVAAALPASVAMFEPFPSAEFFAPFVPLVTPVFLTGGPERPPRSAFA